MIEKEHRTQKVGGGLKMGPGHFLGLFTQRTILGPFENAMFARPPFCPKSVCFLFFPVVQTTNLFQGLEFL